MGHYFTNDDKLESKEKKIKVKLKNKDFTFYTDNGVFSKKGLDFGTRTLLETLEIENIKGKVLDFGCGYGPVGIVISKITDASIDMIDINKRSIALATKNALTNKVKVNIFESNIYDNIKDKYNYIISNPPIRVGKEILYKILFDAKKYLEKQGELWIVINKTSGAKTVLKALQKIYHTEIVLKNKGFYVIKAIND